MTREDLHDWILAHDCEVLLLPDGLRDQRSIRYLNPKTGSRAYLNGPINEIVVLAHVICHVCVQLGIEIPKEASHTKDNVERLRTRNWRRPSE